MNFCSQCGAPVAQAVPPGDTHLRHVCTACQAIHYVNPKVVVGCIPEWQDRILLCRRAIEPRTGYWTFPAGFMEMGERTEEAAARETHEEAGAQVEGLSLFALFTLTYVNQVHVVFRGTLREPAFRAGVESLDAQLVPLDKIPWDDLAFKVIKEILLRYVRDRERGRFAVHVGTVDRRIP